MAVHISVDPGGRADHVPKIWTIWLHYGSMGKKSWGFGRCAIIRTRGVADQVSSLVSSVERHRVGGLPPPIGVDRGHMAIEMRLHGKDAMAICLTRPNIGCPLST